MKRFSYYTIVKHFSNARKNRFFAAMSWMNKQLYRIPVFFQGEIQLTTPRSSNTNRGGISYWWFPELSIGRNQARDYSNDYHLFKVWSVHASWLGIFMGVGMCIKCALPEKKL